ncbi:MAG: sugar ABC transporter substrate-binding protein, partial [Phycisphaerae bacterium]|nr:sugar ABC transporter substrate-binding protein [Phycisphaerae bacterium]
APDVTGIAYQDIPYYAKRKSVLALDKFIADDKEFSLDAYFPATVKGMRYRGKIYALPDHGSPVALFYNKNLFDEYNSKHRDKPLTYPSGKWTWADFRHAARELTQDRDGDGQIDVYGASISFSLNRFPAYVWQNGGEIISADKKRCLMDSPEAIAGIRWLYEMMWVDKSTLTAYTQIEGASQQTMGRFFLEQHLAMMMTTRWAYADLFGKTNFAWDVAPLPKGPVNRATVFIGGGWMISSKTRYPEKAWRLAKFLINEYSSELSMRTGRGVAANRAVVERLVHHPGDPPEHDYIWAEIMADARPKDFDFREMGSYRQRALDELNYISQGRRTPEEACRNFTRIYNEGLKVLWKEGGGP